jgi:hypothetical protein
LECSSAESMILLACASVSWVMKVFLVEYRR